MPISVIAAGGSSCLSRSRQVGNLLVKQSVGIAQPTDAKIQRELELGPGAVCDKNQRMFLHNLRRVAANLPISISSMPITSCWRGRANCQMNRSYKARGSRAATAAGEIKEAPENDMAREDAGSRGAPRVRAATRHLG